MIDSLWVSLAHVTEQAALACRQMIWAWNKHEADRLATEAMRKAFADIDISGIVVIGEWERDDAPMLYIWEKVGAWWVAIDIAVDPLEWTNLCAYNHPGAITVLAVWAHDTLLHAPDTYMDKFIVGPAVETTIHLNMSVKERVDILCEAYEVEPGDIHIIVMKRSRNQQLIDDLLDVWAKVKLIDDGDVCAGIDALMSDTSGIHAMMWIWAAPEWTITAVAVKALGWQMSAKLMPYDSDMNVKNMDVVKRMKTMWASEDTIYTADDLATGDDVLFAATGVTSGTVLEWISEYAGWYVTDTLLLSSGDKPIQYIKTVHKVMHEIEV